MTFAPPAFTNPLRTASFPIALTLIPLSAPSLVPSTRPGSTRAASKVFVTLEDRTGYVEPCWVSRRDRVDAACIRNWEGVGSEADGVNGDDM